MENLEDKINSIARRKVARILNIVEHQHENVAASIKGEVYQMKDDFLMCVSNEGNSDGNKY